MPKNLRFDFCRTGIFFVEKYDYKIMQHRVYTDFAWIVDNVGLVRITCVKTVDNYCKLFNITVQKLSK